MQNDAFSSTLKQLKELVSKKSFVKNPVYICKKCDRIIADFCYKYGLTTFNNNYSPKSKEAMQLEGKTGIPRKHQSHHCSSQKQLRRPKFTA